MYYFQISFIFLLFNLIADAFLNFALRKSNSYSQSNIKLSALREFQYGEIELIKFLGRINMVKSTIDKGNNNDDNVATTIRLFEARIVSNPPKMGERGQRVYIKEYSVDGIKYGRKERKAITKISKNEREKEKQKINQMIQKSELEQQDNEVNPEIFEFQAKELEKDNNNSSTFPLPLLLNYTAPVPPVPQLLGILKVDDRVEDSQFQSQWSRKFPRLQLPQKGFMVLVYNWDSATFRTLSRFPKLPQIIQGFEYFSEERRIKRRYNFISKMIQKILIVISKIHNSGYCHGALTSESIWLTTSNQLEIDQLDVQVADWSNSIALKSVGPDARLLIHEDIYQLGFLLLEIIFASFANDEYRQVLYTQREWQQVFENQLNKDLGQLKKFVSSNRDFNQAVSVLEINNDAIYKLIFKCLVVNDLYDNERVNKINISASKLLNDFRKNLKNPQI